VAFRVMSRSAPKPGEEQEWQEHVRGKIARIDADPPKQYHVQEIIEICSRQEITVTESDINKAAALVYWGPRWMNLRKAYIGTNEGLAVLELSEEFSADLEQFGLHPALLDVATAFGNGLVEHGGSYLPLSYNRVRVRGSLPKKVYSYIRYKEDAQAEKQTISFDITLMDEHGQELVE